VIDVENLNLKLLQAIPTAKLWHDGVLEVVGYTNMTLKEIEDER
jgi:hypothetical protein